jgi:hypothetical protein
MQSAVHASPPISKKTDGRLPASTSRELNNSLTLTFKTSAQDTLATAVQKGSAGVLFGFKNGGSGRYVISGDGGEVIVDCSPKRTTAARGGEALGWIEPSDGGDGAIRRADGTIVANVAGQPAERRREPAWTHGLTDGKGAALGTLTWFRTGATFDAIGELMDMSIWWDRAGAPLKVPSLGAHLSLEHSVADDVGDLLLATCVDLSLGSHSFVRS